MSLMSGLPFCLRSYTLSSNFYRIRNQWYGDAVTVEKEFRQAASTEGFL